MNTAVKTPLLLLGLAVGLAFMVVLTNAGQRPAPTAAASAAVPEEADAAVGQMVLARCGSCHGLNTLMQHPQDAAGWSKTVDSMVQLGAQVPPQDKPALVTYLAKHFGGQ